MSEPRDATRILDRDFLDTRSRILDLAAALDRLDRAQTRQGEAPDRRRDQIRRALEALLEPGPGRSETIQHIFSLEYDPDWMQKLAPATRKSR